MMDMRLNWFSIFVGFALLWPVQALSADDAEAKIAQCRKSTRLLAEQVVCLENALRQSGYNPTMAQGSTQQPIDQQRRQSGSIVGAITSRLPFGLGSERVPLDREQAEIASQTERLEEQSVLIDFAYNKSNRLILVLDNGQVWKQINSDLQTVRLEDGEQPSVLIRRGKLSGYRMEFVDKNRTLIVTRLR